MTKKPSLKIIGRGTWYDKTAHELIQREVKLGRSMENIRTESGLGASGFPHIGSLGDAIRNYAVALAVGDQGYNSELIAFSDDKDGLRRVPQGISFDMKKWLGYPVSEIPDPFGNCHTSYGTHMTSLLLEGLDKSGVEYTFKSGTEVYKNGVLNDEIILIMENKDKVGEIIKQEIGQEKYTETFPYFATCKSCGRIYTTHVFRYIPEAHKALYRCSGMEIRNKWIEGCGHEGEVDVLSGEGKLSWKVEFAARWRALDIRFEAYGKDIADSVRVNDRICREILDFEPPMHAQYEMFLDKTGKKISKSAGNVFTPQIWYRYGSPQSLNLLILKRFAGTKSGSIEEIPVHMDELDYLEDLYYGKKRVRDDKERAKLRGLYEYCWMLKTPDELGIHIPYNLMINIVRMAPKGLEIDFSREKLKSYGYLMETEANLEQRISYALNWIEDFGEPKLKRKKLSEEEIRSIYHLIEQLKKVDDEDSYQSSVFEVAKKIKINPKKLFQLTYQILLGQKHGPRFGPYVSLIGKEKVIQELQKSIESL
jgi:lysyl-tRNA synthetase class 1